MTRYWPLVALALIASGALIGARYEMGGASSHFDQFEKDGVDAGIRYFAKAGSLTANSDSAVVLSYLKVINQDTGHSTFRLYGPHGNVDGGTDSAYTEIRLEDDITSATVASLGAGTFVSPPGMRITGIRWTLDPDSCIVYAGR